MDYTILQDKKFVISENLIKSIEHNMTLNEFLVLIYFLNDTTSSFDVDKITKSLNITLEETMEAVNGLIGKELINITQDKDLDGRFMDKVLLDGTYQKIMKKLNQDQNIKKEENIFDQIELVFNRKLTPYEAEIVNGWLDIKIPIELIQKALKEASYNGILTFKYLDKLLYDWSKKGFKTSKEIDDYLTSRDTKKNNEEIFDYDWLDEDE